MVKSGLGITLGAIEIGIIINACVFGISIIQLINYYNAHFDDSWRIQTLVWWTILIDVAHTMIITEMLWRLTIDGFGDFALLAAAPWEYDSTPYFVIGAAVPIQIFLAWRVKRLIKARWGWLVFGLIATCSVTAGIFGFYVATQLLRFVRMQAGYTAYVQVANAWTATSTVTDVLIAGSLTFLLLSRRTGFKKTDHMITSLIAIAVESAIPVSIFSLGHVIAVARGPQTGIHEMFLIPLGRLYTNTLLATLNSRASIQRDLDSAADLQSIHLTRLAPTKTEVRIDVERQEADDDHTTSKQDGSSRSDFHSYRKDMPL